MSVLKIRNPETGEWEVVSGGGTGGEAGPAGPQGEKGDTGPKGDTGATGAAGYSPVRGTDYWTAADIAEIKGYVDTAILNGSW